jgi:hypothetical protein
MREEAVGIFHADVLVVLHQVHAIGLEPLERFVDLAGGGLPLACLAVCICRVDRPG